MPYPCCCRDTPGESCSACPGNDAPAYITLTISGWTQPLGLGPNLNGDWVIPYDFCLDLNVDTGLNCGAVDLWRPSAHYQTVFSISSIPYTFGIFLAGNSSTPTLTTFWGNVIDGGGGFGTILEYCGVRAERGCRDFSEAATVTYEFSSTPASATVTAP